MNITEEYVYLKELNLRVLKDYKEYLKDNFVTLPIFCTISGYKYKLYSNTNISLAEISIFINEKEHFLLFNSVEDRLVYVELYEEDTRIIGPRDMSTEEDHYKLAIETLLKKL